MFPIAKNYLSRHYILDFENIGVRILYFFNTLDTYFIVAGAGSFMLYHQIYNAGPCFFIKYIFLSLFVLLLFKI